MRILYIGSDSSGSTSLQRAQALMRLGYEVEIINPYKALVGIYKRHVMTFINYRTGYQFVQPIVLSYMQELLSKKHVFDLAWIDSGELIGEKILNLLKYKAGKTILYNHDDPTGPRDWGRFKLLRSAISLYDAAVVVRAESESEYKNLGAKKVIRVWRSYDEVVHAPLSYPERFASKFKCDVVFVGTWMRGENRERILLALIDAGFSVRIWGDRWEKSKLWKFLKPFYGGGGLKGEEYVAALQNAKLSLGLLSKGNRDLHTTRSLEIPYAGGLLFAERTAEHMDLYKDREEAIFWGEIEECLSLCRRYVNSDAERELIRKRGMEKVRALGVGHEDICSYVISLI